MPKTEKGNFHTAPYIPSKTKRSVSAIKSAVSSLYKPTIGNERFKAHSGRSKAGILAGTYYSTVFGARPIVRGIVGLRRFAKTGSQDKNNKKKYGIRFVENIAKKVNSITQQKASFDENLKKLEGDKKNSEFQSPADQRKIESTIAYIKRRQEKLAGEEAHIESKLLRGSKTANLNANLTASRLAQNVTSKSTQGAINNLIGKESPIQPIEPIRLSLQEKIAAIKYNRTKKNTLPTTN